MKLLPQHVLALMVLVGSFASAAVLQAQEGDEKGIRFFEQKIRPVLVEHCYECHSDQAKPLRAELRLDHRASLLAGGDSGPSIVPGDPRESLLLQTMRYTGESYDMPPKGKLPDHVIADFETWISMGAPDPRNDDAPPVTRKGIDMEAGRQFWSLQPPRKSPAPAVNAMDWPRNKIDAFILAALEQAGIPPAPPADRRTLIRRVALDLTGLPPTYQEVEEFANDPDPQAYAKLLDRLLASPHYGERWARHWLDVARYGEDNVNMGPHNGPYKNAYRYRDWIIGALNADMPYDEFIRRQLATDLLPDNRLEDLAALGLLGLSPQNHKELQLAQITLEGQYADEWEDRVDVVTRGLLGLTVACARCHDHKYDPITAKDYHALAGVFASIRQTERPLLPADEVAKSQPARDTVKKWEDEITILTRDMNLLKREKPTAEPEIAAQKEKLATFQSQIAEKKQAVKDLIAATPNYAIPSVDGITEEQVRIEKFDEKSQKIVYFPNTPRDLPLYIRGNITSPGEIVPRRFLEVLCAGEPVPFQQGSGRLELAEAIVAPTNPLTARVIVNRIWAHHFGQGLVDTPSNFGQTGSAPSHPELLDDLAVSFMEQGWSLKTLHREIMLSATYQQASHVEPTALTFERDPGNRLLWRFNRQRLDAETFHDALLVAGGQINLEFGGPSASIDDPTFARRAIYGKVSRDAPSLFLQVNDFPDPTLHAEQRSLTTTPLQQLFVLNSPFVKNQAKLLSERVTSDDLTGRIQEIYRVLFGRDATSAEVELGRKFVFPDSDASENLELQQQLSTFAGQRMKARVPAMGETYSVEIWFRNSVPYRERPITGYLFSRGNDGALQADGDHLGIGGTSKPDTAGRLLFFNGNRLKEVLYGTTVLEMDRWHHVALIREGRQVRIHLNGQLTPEIVGAIAPSYDPVVEEMFLGGRNDRFANFRGRMGGVSVYNRALSAAEIGAHYEAAKVSDAASGGSPVHERVTQTALAATPLSYWPLFERSMFDLQARDLTMHGHHGIYETAMTEGERSPLNAWRLYCHALLCSNELLYVD